jgi:hypothetical protein
MTIPSLIDRVLDNIKWSFYGDRRREFLRDRQALLKAIARYGYDCEARGWDLDAELIASELLALLAQVRERRAEIEYLPVYLEGAVDRRIRIRAEELSAEAKRMDNQVKRTLAGVRVGEPPPRSDTETLADVYRQLRTGRPKKRVKPAQQLNLL